MRDELAAFTAGLELDQLRPVAAGQLHVTVVFLGNVRNEAIADLAAAMSDVTAREPAFRLEVLHARPAPERRPRMLWALLSPSEELARLSRALHETARHAAPERARPLRGYPHITLARFRRPVPGLEPADLPLSARAFDVTELQLIRSHLSQTGAHHEAIATLALAAK